VEALTGATVWSRPVGGATFVPALAAGRLYLATDGGTLLALDAAGGAEVWRREGAAPAGRASVHARGAQLLVLAADDQVLAFAAADGAPAWQRRLPGAFASGLAFGGEAVYLLGGAAALALADGAVLWQSSSRGLGECAAPTVAGGQVLAAAGPQSGSLSVLAASGKPLGSLAEAAQRACDGAIVAGGRIYTAGGGRVLAVACRPKG
jgi:outer membrane protein assembly factor BamB